MTQIIIGRDPQTGQFRLTANGKSMVTGEKDSVPKGISREHVSVTIDDDGKVTLRNLNIENDTFVNNIGIETKRISKGDAIQLGKEHFPLDWGLIEPFIPKFAEIRPLKKVWDDYQQQLLDMQIRERRSGVMRSATGLSTMAAMVLSVFTGRDNPLFLALYVLAGIVSAFFFVKAFRDSSKIPKQQQKIRDSLPQKYVCPQCGHFMGNQSYEVISQGRACPHCKAIYIK